MPSLHPTSLDAMLADLEELITTESPSSDTVAVARSADTVTDLCHRRLGARPERIVLDGVPHLRLRFGGGRPRVLVLGHHDTVWPIGSLERLPFAVRDGMLTGPGCFDMKAGIVIAIHAIALVAERSPEALDGLTFLLTGDEEIGSPTSRELIETEAAGCVAALVLEAAAEHGELKTSRKGVSSYQVVFTGLAAHAGLEPEKGVNAAIELAHQTIRLGELADPLTGTTVTPTVATAGDARNTVPAQAHLYVDVRVRALDEQRRIDETIRRLEPVVPGAKIEVLGGPNRPPMEASASVALYTRAERLAAMLGYPPPGHADVGGASDGNFTAGIGIPTLDGLGAVGGGAHADNEHVIVKELPRRAALLAALIEDLVEVQP